ncbi:MAG: HAMP domain-containing histidine kinase [Clostridia bacterium]|nr:HAMP domain-containing histidine kinase [Clostridia bacterium]
MGKLSDYTSKINKKIFFGIVFLFITLVIFGIGVCFWLNFDKKAISLVCANNLILFVFFIVFILLSQNYNKKLISVIVVRLKNIYDNSKKILNNDYEIELKKDYDDEIGDLYEIINFVIRELRESEKIKNDFVSSVSHELRTPLTAIKGWAETMQMCDPDSDSETITRGLDTIVREVSRLSWIVESMLDFSSIKDKKINLIKEKIDILAELGEAVYMFKNRAQTENKTLIYNEPKSIPILIGDKNRIKQIFINILDNALKYTSENGGISVSVSEKNNFVCVQVTDNGCGIPSKHLPNVTKKFYKANTTQKGSGIGLAIVDELVNLHDGKLEIISEENFGTTVIISFPIPENFNQKDPSLDA